MTDSSNSVPQFTELNNLASNRNGAEILFATDDWFAEAENLLAEEEAVFKEGLFTDCGKWMDGWETRRKRQPGHDWCIIKLAMPGVIFGVEVDTAFFTGNFAPRFSIQAANLKPEDLKHIPTREANQIGIACTDEMIEQMAPLKSDSWQHLIRITPLKSGYEETRHNYFEVNSRETFTHLRLNMFPDGGIARLRVYGEVFLEKQPHHTDQILDLVALEHGGVCKGYSNAHYGHPRNLIRAGGAANMGDGWETARRLDRPAVLSVDEEGVLQVPGEEWALFRLGYIGELDRIEVDTTHFKGNYPDSVRIEGTRMPVRNRWDEEAVKEIRWKDIVTTTKLCPHKIHKFSKSDMNDCGPFSHIKITMAPDGGIGRLRIFGVPLDNVKLIPAGF